jgi:hypothetical protein
VYDRLPNEVNRCSATVHLWLGTERATLYSYGRCILKRFGHFIALTICGALVLATGCQQRSKISGSTTSLLSDHHGSEKSSELIYRRLSTNYYARLEKTKGTDAETWRFLVRYLNDNDRDHMAVIDLVAVAEATPNFRQPVFALIENKCIRGSRDKRRLFLLSWAKLAGLDHLEAKFMPEMASIEDELFRSGKLSQAAKKFVADRLTSKAFSEKLAALGILTNVETNDMATKSWEIDQVRRTREQAGSDMEARFWRVVEEAIVGKYIESGQY